MNIFKLFNFFKDTPLVDIFIMQTYITMPKELKKDSLLNHAICIDNYSNKTIEKVLIQYEFKNLYSPKVCTHDNKEYSFLNEENSLTIQNLLPKTKLYIDFYPNEQEQYCNKKPKVYIDGCLLNYKSKLLNFFRSFFLFKYLSVFLFFSILITLGSIFYAGSKLYIFDKEMNTFVSKKEYIHKQFFNYYQKHGLEPMLSEFDVISPPKTFYEQEELKKRIKNNCNEKYILELNGVDSYNSLFKLNQISICN